MELSMTKELQSGLLETRKFKKLRVSITDYCNLACMYCDTQNGKAQVSEKSNIPLLLGVIEKLHSSLALSSVRITGGEPTTHAGLTEFIRQLKIMGIPEINLTSNGIYLENLLPRLRETGLDRINLSLDSLDEENYAKITRQPGVSRVIRSLVRALDLGFSVKMNSIIMKGINENQVLPLLEFAGKHNVVIRYLELMKMGRAAKTHQDRYYSQEEILSQIRSRYELTEVPRELSSTARYYQTRDAMFGIIANHTQPFCEDCDRLRLDHKGNLFGCLSNPESLSLAGREESEYPAILEKAMSLKQKQKFIGSSLSMRYIGG